MICYDCVKGGEENVLNHLKRAENHHNKCEGDCGCQHKVGTGWTKRADTKVPLMQIQSP